MCGIAGFVNWKGESEEALLRIAARMGSTLIHRGPDDSGNWADADAGVALAHRRLSIVDLSPLGHQPMFSVSGRYVIVYNGEIYNHRDLRDQLGSRGATFRGHSDTEVLLAAIDAFGLRGGLERCVGMFAMAVWDRQLRRLSLARDRLGEKPLFVARTPGGIAFASETRALAHAPGFRGRTDPSSVGALLRYGYLPGVRSIFEDVVRLAPGSIAHFDAPGDMVAFALQPPSSGGALAKQEFFWRVDDVAPAPAAMTVSEAVDELERRLKDAVRLQMVADVPVGAFLSGGVDSSTVTALMCELASSPVMTFSIAFDDARYNEAHHAREVARHLGTDHHELRVSAADALKVVGQLNRIYDEPFADPSQIPTYVIAGFARQSVTVALSGDGGDELFGGYNRYSSGAKLAEVQRRIGPVISRYAARIGRGALGALPPAMLERLIARMTGGGGTAGPVQDPLGKARRACEFLASGDPARAYLGLIAGWAEPSDAMPRLGSDDSALLDLDAAIAGHGWVIGAMRWDLRHYLPGDNLTKVDRASMAVSLETRVPLLDHRVVEFALQAADALGAAPMVAAPKYLLRELLYRRVPRALIDRPKMGFSVPLCDWLRNDLREWADDLLSESALARDGWFAADVIRQTWSEHVQHKADRSRQLWPLLMYQQWAQGQRATVQANDA